MALHPQVKALLDQLAAANAPAFSELPPEQARAAFATLVSMMPKTDAEIGGTRDIEIPGESHKIPARIYTPSEPDGSLPAILFFHGGGFVIGDIETYDAVCRGLCAGSGAAVISVAYRLAPEHPFPAATDDCLAAARWVANNAATLGVDASRFAVAGDSAGGNLAAVTAQRLRDEGGPALRAQLLIYPAVNVSETPTQSMLDNAEGYLLTRDDMEWFLDHYAGKAPALDDPKLSPLQADRLDGLPPARVITAGFDPLRDEGQAYADALEAAGVSVDRSHHDDTIHGFFSFFTLLEGGQREMKDSANWLRRQLFD